MSKYFLVSCLMALLTTGCHSSPSTPADTTTAAPTAAQADMSHMAGMAATGSGPRAQAMRLHDASMNQMDALTSERQRLTDRLAQLSPTVPAAQRSAARLRRTVAALKQADDQMMDWMHQLQEPDSTSQPKEKVDAYWQQQLPGLRQLDQRITAALDSAKAIR